MTVARIAACALAAVSAWSADLAAVAQQKIDLILEGRAKRGSVVTFTPAECNAWAHASLPGLVPKGVRNEVLEFGYDTITASAMVDFIAVREGLGHSTGMILSRLLKGERAVKAQVRVASANGQATVYLMRLDVGGATMSGSMLDTLIDNVLKPVLPNAKINEPIQLSYGIDRIEVRPTAVRVVMKN